MQDYNEIINCYTYLGSVMDPSPYLLTFWLVVLILALNIADTDMCKVKANNILCYMFNVKLM